MDEGDCEGVAISLTRLQTSHIQLVLGGLLFLFLSLFRGIYSFFIGSNSGKRGKNGRKR
jgi:hypothetical protein